jgi:hypothetical protein
LGDYDQDKQKQGQAGTTDPTKTSQGGWNDRTQNERDQAYPQGSGQTGNPGQAGQTGNTGMTGNPGQTGQTGSPPMTGSQPRPGMTPGDDKAAFKNPDDGSQRGSGTDKETQNQNR